MMYGLREVGGMVRETQHGRLDAYGNSLGESRVDSLPRTLEADST